MNTVESKVMGRCLLLVSIFFVLIVFLSGCNPGDEEKLDIRGSESVLYDFERIFCRNNVLIGEQLDKYNPTVWTVGVEEAAMPCRIFTAITGSKVEFSDAYQASFQTIDGKCTLTVNGAARPSDGIYAVMQVNLPNYPQVTKIRMVDTELLNDKNEVVTDATTGEQT